MALETLISFNYLSLEYGEIKQVYGLFLKLEFYFFFYAWSPKTFLYLRLFIFFT